MISINNIYFICIIITSIYSHSYKLINVISNNSNINHRNDVNMNESNIYGYYLVTHRNIAKKFDDIGTTKLFRTRYKRILNITIDDFYLNYIRSNITVPLIKYENKVITSDDTMRVTLLMSKYINDDLIESIRYLGNYYRYLYIHIIIIIPKYIYKYTLIYITISR